MEHKRISEICDYLPKSNLKAGLGNKEGTYPFFTSSDKQTLFIDKCIYNNEALIFGTGGSASCNYYNGKFSTSTDNIVITSKKINLRYLYYFFRNNNMSVLQEGFHGAGLNHISKSYFGNIEIPMFSSQKQKEIVDILDNINNQIKKDEKQLICFDELIKSRFIEMFTNAGYEKKQIRYFVDTKKISAKKKYSAKDNIKYIDISSIDNESNLITGYTNYVFSEAPSRAQQCLKANDILVSTVRPNLRNIAIFLSGDDGYVGSSGFCVLRATKCNPQYLKYVVLNEDFTNAMVELTTGASYPAIRDEDVLNYEMIDAPIELQNEFASFVEQIDKSKFIVQKRINLYKELLDKKMNEFFE